jgi:hypothetical protein
VGLPQDVVLDADVAEQPVDFLVAPEERVEPALQPVAVAIPPRRQLATGDVPALEDERGTSRVGEVFGGG